MSGSVFSVKYTVIVNWPVFELVDVMYMKLSTPLIWASIGYATESPTVFASAPGYVVVTWMVTGVMLGYCSTGRFFMQTSPAITMMVDITVAKMGWSMKNLENISGPLF